MNYPPYISLSNMPIYDTIYCCFLILTSHIFIFFIFLTLVIVLLVAFFKRIRVQYADPRVISQKLILARLAAV